MCSCNNHCRQERIEMLFTSTGLDSDSVKISISDAIKTWEECKWSKDYNDSIFINYIVPPCIADEPVEYYWREDIPEKIGITYNGECLIDFARILNSKVEVNTKPSSWSNAQMGYSATISGNFGKCDDRAILAAMTMRSYGIPAAFDFVPLWGSGNNGHSFCSVVLQDNSLLVFQDKNDIGSEYEFSHKTAKIYRRTFVEDHNNIIHKQRSNESIPSFFLKYKIQDVTSQHQIGFKSISLGINTGTDNKIGYLSIFHPSGWQPIAYGEIDNSSIRFSHVGTGLNHKGETALKGEDIGNGILYLPIIYNGGIVPIDTPFILSDNGIRYIHPSNETEDVVLRRKYPRLSRILKFARYMNGGIIEGANNSDFSDAKPIYHIHKTPESHLQGIKLSNRQSFRYIRYRKPSGTFSLAEFKIFGHNGAEITGTHISSEELNHEDINVIYDGDPLTYFELSNIHNLWIGLDCGNSEIISEVAFCPRTDDNDISPGDLYELLYWKDEWKSLGLQKAISHNIKFCKVPKGALLWLRNRTKGKEERPFTYENSKQIWW